MKCVIWVWNEYLLSSTLCFVLKNVKYNILKNNGCVFLIFKVSVFCVIFSQTEFILIGFPQDAFWGLVQICEKYLPGYYSPGLVRFTLMLIMKEKITSYCWYLISLMHPDVCFSPTQLRLLALMSVISSMFQQAVSALALLWLQLTDADTRVVSVFSEPGLEMRYVIFS